MWTGANKRTRSLFSEFLDGRYAKVELNESMSKKIMELFEPQHGIPKSHESKVIEVSWARAMTPALRNARSALPPFVAPPCTPGAGGGARRHRAYCEWNEHMVHPYHTLNI